jgi:hypothetical protein
MFPSVPARALAPRLRQGTLWAVLFWPSFVHGNGSTCKLFAMQGGDRRLTFCVVTHGHKGKAARSAGLSIGDDARLPDCSKLFEDIPKISFGRIE